MFPLKKIPFSRYGSYSVVSIGRDGEVYLRDLHGGDMAPSVVYRLWSDEFDLKNEEITMTPWELIFKSKTDQASYISIVMGEDSSVYICAKGCKLHLEAADNRYDSVIELSDQEWEHQLYAKNRKLKIIGNGGIIMKSTWQISESKNISFIIDGTEKTEHAIIQNYLITPPAINTKSYEEAKQSVKNNYQAWTNAFNKEPSNTYEELARYILWGNVVCAEGCLHYDAMYMTKGVMNNIWSWDNCFGALALAKDHPQLAWKQIDLFRRWQDKSGALPDYINDVYASYSCQKPPIYGLVAKELQELNSYFSQKEIIKPMYDLMANMVNFWIENRTQNQWKLPCYYHGNDSGWDNASVFHNGVPVFTPDLSAFLIHQMDTISAYAKELNMLNEAENWTKRADLLYNKLITHLYDDDKECFVSKNLKSGLVDEQSESLLNYLPLVIAYRFPKDMTNKLVAKLQDLFECKYGLATERLTSAYYKKGGYWQGPIWAPVTYIFVLSLRKAGFSQFADRLADKFSSLPQHGLMAENFDPETGEGYDDNSFAWTAAVYHLFNN